MKVPRPRPKRCRAAPKTGWKSAVTSIKKLTKPLDRPQFSVKQQAMKRWILSLIALFVSISVHASAAVASFNFADLEWSSSQELVKETLAKKGYKYNSKKDNIFIFEGNVAGNPAEVYCIFDKENRLVRLVLRFPTKDSECLDCYAKMKESLSKKYGKPTDDYEIFRAPYEKGDGHQELAIKTNKATIKCFWQKAQNSSSLMLEVESNLTVLIHYESKDWSKEADRLEDEANEDL
jgi:hypothetical protein